MRKLAIVLLLAIATAHPGTAASPGANANSEEAIRKIVADFASARNSLDGHRMSVAYADNAEFAPFGQMPIHGRAAIEENWSNILRYSPRAHVDRKVSSIQFVWPDLAVVHVQSHFSGPAGTLDFADTFVMSRKARQWRIALHESVLPYHESARPAQGRQTR